MFGSILATLEKADKDENKEYISRRINALSVGHMFFSDALQKIFEEYHMRRNNKKQRVNIDEYFEGFEDLAEPIEIQPSWHPAASLVSQPFKAILTGKSGNAYPVLAPYHRQNPVLNPSKPLNSIELEAAHRAVTSIKSQLLGEPDPAVQTQIFQPVSAVSAPLNAITVPTSEPAQSSFRVWWVSTVAILGASVAALSLYAYHNHQLIDFAQVKTLSHLSLVQARRLSQMFLEEARLPLTSPTAIIGTDYTVDQAAMTESMKLAYTAAELTQSATTSEDWQQVLIFWRRAIDELQVISPESSLFKQSQERRQIYEDSLVYAQGELEMAPFRLAVNAAETASHLASSAKTPEDWAKVATKWQEALSNMELVSAKNPRYEVAQTKLAEYATKFAYSQNRYLALQPRGSL